MKVTIHRMILAIMLIVFVALPAVQAQKTFKNFSLKDGQNQDVWLKDIAKGKKAAVVVLTSSHCVFAVKYEGRLKELYETHGKENVAFLAVNSNDPSMSQRDALSRITDESPYEFPYLKDTDQKVAQALEATRNPEAFILLPINGTWDKFKIAYQGKIDDNPLDPAAVKSHFLKDALTQVLSGQRPEKVKVPATGCPIKWIRK